MRNLALNVPLKIIVLKATGKAENYLFGNFFLQHTFRAKLSDYFKNQRPHSKIVFSKIKFYFFTLSSRESQTFINWTLNCVKPKFTYIGIQILGTSKLII